MLDVYKVYLKHLLDSNRAADAAAYVCEKKANTEDANRAYVFLPSFLPLSRLSFVQIGARHLWHGREAVGAVDSLLLAVQRSQRTGAVHSH